MKPATLTPKPQDNHALKATAKQDKFKASTSKVSLAQNKTQTKRQPK